MGVCHISTLASDHMVPAAGWRWVANSAWEEGQEWGNVEEQRRTRGEHVRQVGTWTRFPPEEFILSICYTSIYIYIYIYIHICMYICI